MFRVRNSAFEPSRSASTRKLSPGRRPSRSRREPGRRWCGTSEPRVVGVDGDDLARPRRSIAKAQKPSAVPTSSTLRVPASGPATGSCRVGGGCPRPRGSPRRGPPRWCATRAAPRSPRRLDAGRRHDPSAEYRQEVERPEVIRRMPTTTALLPRDRTRVPPR